MCIDRWLVMTIFSYLTMHFDALFDCSKGNFNRHCRQLLGHKSFYIVFKKKENRIDVKGGGGGEGISS